MSHFSITMTSITVYFRSLINWHRFDRMLFALLSAITCIITVILSLMSIYMIVIIYKDINFTIYYTILMPR